MIDRFSGRLASMLGMLLAGVAILVMPDEAARAQNGDAAAECVPLAEQFPELGTSQSVSARFEFTTVWGSFELPGGPCGYASAEEHYNALLEDAESRGGPSEHTMASLPDWSGHWGTENSTGEIAIVGRAFDARGHGRAADSGSARGLRARLPDVERRSRDRPALVLSAAQLPALVHRVRLPGEFPGARQDGARQRDGQSVQARIHGWTLASVRGMADE